MGHLRNVITVDRTYLIYESRVESEGRRILLLQILSAASFISASVSAKACFLAGTNRGRNRYELKSSLQTDRSVYYSLSMKAWIHPLVRRLGVLSSCLAHAPAGLTPAEQRQPANQMMNDTNPLSSFQVIEFRRYTIKEGERETFIRYFETYFREAFEQLGALALGQFREGGNASGLSGRADSIPDSTARSLTVLSISALFGVNTV
jgi:hypothetical protein